MIAADQETAATDVIDQEMLVDWERPTGHTTQSISSKKYGTSTRGVWPRDCGRCIDSRNACKTINSAAERSVNYERSCSEST